MFTITKEFRFEAAHKLNNHDGKCARLHGHSWKMRVILEGASVEKEGPKKGMLMDFSEVSKIVNPLLEEKLDHYYLNDTLKLENPTSEAIAQWLYNQLVPKLTKLVAIEVDETCTCSCRYEP